VPSLEIGQVHRPNPKVTNHSPNQLPPQRAYRTVCVQRSDDTVVDCIDQPSYKWAHICEMEWESIYEYPHKQCWVERSIDGGATWHRYDADERIAGRPAWTYDNL
jgi:hypothetical protein